MPPIHIIVMFAIYWVIVLIRALIPRGPVYSKEDNGSHQDSYLITPGFVFSAKNRIAITLVCLVVSAVSFLFWEESVNFLKPTFIFIFGPLLAYVFVLSSCVCCLFLIIIPVWIILVFKGIYLLFIFLPAKAIQLLGLALSGGPE